MRSQREQNDAIIREQMMAVTADVEADGKRYPTPRQPQVTSETLDFATGRVKLRQPC